MYVVTKTLFSCSKIKNKILSVQGFNHINIHFDLLDLKFTPKESIRRSKVKIRHLCLKLYSDDHYMYSEIQCWSVPRTVVYSEIQCWLVPRTLVYSEVQCCPAKYSGVQWHCTMGRVGYSWVS